LPAAASSVQWIGRNPRTEKAKPICPPLIQFNRATDGATEPKSKK
jgi:hypothetical protein